MKTNVADLMTTEVVSVDETAGFSQMVELIKQHRISALPVVDGRRRVIGVVSEADLILKEDRIDLLPCLYGDRSADLSVGSVMHPPVTISADATLAEAADLMLGQEIHRLLVVEADDPGSFPLGLIATSDFVTEISGPESL